MPWSMPAPVIGVADYWPSSDGGITGASDETLG